MFGLRKPARRFSLVLLEEGEDYVGDWVVKCYWPASISGNWQSLETLAGTLRLCSKSLFFEPDDVRVPIARLPFATTQRLEPEGSKTFALTTTLVVKMKANMADAPYLFLKRAPTNWRFSLVYAQMSQLVPLVHQYLAASRMPRSEREEALQALTQQRAREAAFDTSRLVNFNEAVRYDAPAMQLTPLVKEAGRLVITDQRLYFQPLDNVAGDMPVRMHPLPGIAAVARRRSSLKPVGVELFFIEAEDAQLSGPTWGGPSAFFAFESEEERERVVTILMEQTSLGSALPGGRTAAAACASILEAKGEWLQRVTSAWQHGRITNLDYLLYCNLAAGRSFNDLTQWPVFPWVLADYHSKQLDLDSLDSFRDLSLPMGALNASRLEMLRKRYREMPREEGMDPPFLFGTHYSCPGYVMYWLVRAAPGHLLRLQNGRFDSADRLFISIGDSYQSATSNPADVKELIPEFFLPDHRFLVNQEHLPLGVRQSGAPVGNVELPAWAANPQDFLIKHRAALESPAVSANLHHWLDLIFGYKQQGLPAEEADNVFHYLTYEGAVDVASITDKRHRAALEVQINEFGQCPRQIFSTPHPSRLVCPSSTEALAIAREAIAGRGGRASASGESGDSGGRTLSLVLLSTIMAVASADATPPPVDPKVPELLQKLDMLAQRGGQPTASVPATASATSETRPNSTNAVQGQIQRPAPSGASAAHAGARRSAERIRGWGTNLGGHISSLVGNLTKGPNDASAVASPKGGPISSPGAQARLPPALKGLFQRQGALSPTRRAPSEASTPKSPGLESPQQGSVGDRQENAVPAGEDEPAVSSLGQAQEPEVYVSGRDVEAENLAAALGSTNLEQTQQLAVTDPGEVSSRSGVAEDGPALQGRKVHQTWGPGLAERLAKQRKEIVAHHTAINAVATGMAGGAGMAYCVSQSGTLKIFNLPTGLQVRAANLGGVPLTSVALLESQSSPGLHPTVLAGSFDNKVYAYSVEYGRVLGSFTAHDDTVSCLQLLHSPARLLTASWDGSVKLWSLAEGREPWAAVPALPETELEVDASIWSVSAEHSCGTLLTGSEDGTVAAWDMRTQDSLWQVEASPSGDYISSVKLTPDGHFAVVTAGDGRLSLLELRKSGACLSKVDLGAPLRCGQTDGDVALAGSEKGQVHIWDIAQQQGRVVSGGFKPPAPDGLYPALATAASSINSLSVLRDPDVDAAYLVAALEKGSLCCFSEPS